MSPPETTSRIWQVEGFCEIVVAFVVGRHGHDGARPVGNQHVVRNPDGNALSIHRIEGESAGKRARFVVLQFSALEIRLAGRLLDIGRNLVETVGRRYLRHKGMLRRQHHIGGPEKRIRAGP